MDSGLQPPLPVALPASVSIGNSIPIQPALLNDMEQSAEQISLQLSTMLASLRKQLQDAALATLDSVKLYESAAASADGVCGQVQACVSQTTDLISRCDEMDKDMAAIYDIAVQVKAIRQAVDMLASNVK